MQSFTAILTGLILTGALNADKSAPPLRSTVPQDGPIGMKFAHLAKATFYMGGGGGKAGKKTEIQADFEIAIYTVTQGQWREIMGNNPSHYSRTAGGKEKVKDIADADLQQFPVENVSWNDAQAFIKKLNDREHRKGWEYRLPTEAEWEFACRGGATSEKECSYHFYFDKPTNTITSKDANYGDGHLGRPSRVGSYKPNQLGLFDMHGNVFQWCADMYENGPGRVTRGGSFYDDESGCQASYSGWMPPAERSDFHGFRLVRVVSRPTK